jgi:hypothetical protein
MKNRQMITLLCAIAISLVAATSANAGLAVLHSTPKNDLPNLPRLAVLHSTPNDLPGLLHAEYFTWVLSSNEKITGEALAFTNIRGWTKESDKQIFINQGIGDNFAGHGKLVSNLWDSLGGKPQNFNTVIDFGKPGFRDTSNAYAETAPGTDQTSFGFRIDPDSNDFYDVTLATPNETMAPISHHSP